MDRMNRRPNEKPVHARTLVETMSRELDAVRALRSAVTAQRAAVERADADGLRRAADLVRDRARELADLARARERMTASLGVAAGATLEAIVAHLRGDETAAAIERLGGVLRAEAATAAREVATVRHAAERLAVHLAGMRSLVTAPGAGVYGRRGRIAPSERALAVDLRH